MTQPTNTNKAQNFRTELQERYETQKKSKGSKVRWLELYNIIFDDVNITDAGARSALVHGKKRIEPDKRHFIDLVKRLRASFNGTSEENLEAALKWYSKADNNPSQKEIQELKEALQMMFEQWEGKKGSPNSQRASNNISVTSTNQLSEKTNQSTSDFVTTAVASQGNTLLLSSSYTKSWVCLRINILPTKIINVYQINMELQSNESIKHFKGKLELSPTSLHQLFDISYGRKLFELLFNQKTQKYEDSTASGYAQILSLPKVKVQLQIDRSLSELQDYKWETLWDNSANLALAIMEKTPFARVLEVNCTDHRPFIDSKNKLRVLIAIASPSNLTTLGLSLIEKDDKETLRRNFEHIAQKAPLEYELMEYTSLNSLYKCLADASDAQKPFHIINFLCHGLVEDGKGYLILHASDNYYNTKWNEIHKVPEEELAEKIAMFNNDRNQNGLQLVVLMSCYTAERTGADGLSGVGRRLAAEGKLPAVIAMQDELQLESAQLFIQRFYHHLAYNGMVDEAVNASRRELYNFKQNASNEQLYRIWSDQWYAPVLFMQRLDGQLFLVTEQEIPDFVPELIRPTSFQNYRTQTLPLKHSTLPHPLIDYKPLKSEPLNINLEHKLHISPLVISQAIAALNAGKHLILVGPPGTGKTALAKALAEHAGMQSWNLGFLPVTATADWTTFDTIGGYLPSTEHQLTFRAGLFLEALAKQSWLIIDELNRADIDKAFGEFFNVLSGHIVTLPYQVDERKVRIVPIATPFDPRFYDYKVDESWRVIGTMNLYDKAALFSLSYAFKRRFAFIHLDVPKKEQYDEFLQKLMDEAGLINKQDLINQIQSLIDPKGPFSRTRKLGPALIIDIIDYLKQRYRGDNSEYNSLNYLAEALALFVVPQLEGLYDEELRDICKYLKNHLFKDKPDREPLFDLLKDMFPFLSTELED